MTPPPHPDLEVGTTARTTRTRGPWETFTLSVTVTIHACGDGLRRRFGFKDGGGDEVTLLLVDGSDDHEFGRGGGHRRGRRARGGGHQRRVDLADSAVRDGHVLLPGVRGICSG